MTDPPGEDHERQHFSMDREAYSWKIYRLQLFCVKNIGMCTSKMKFENMFLQAINYTCPRNTVMRFLLAVSMN